MISAALALHIALFVIVAVAFLASGQGSLFHPVTWYLGFHGLVFVLRPGLVHWLGFDTNWRYMGFEPTDEGFIRTLAVSSVGLVCFVGASIMASRARARFGSLRAPGFDRLQQRGLLMVTLTFIPLVAYSIYATRNGIEGERIGGVYINTKSVGYVNDAQFAILPLLCCWLTVSRFHWLNAAPVAAYIGYRSWFGWSRFTIVLFFLVVVVVYCWQRRLKWPPQWALVAAIPLLFLFDALGRNRDYLKAFFQGNPVPAVQFDPGMTRAQRFKQRFDTVDFGNFDFLAFIVAMVPERTETYTYGTQYLQLFTEPIPRKLWAGKPIGAPVSFFNLNSYGNFIGLTYSLCGDGWMSGGWIGLVITMSLIGGFLGWAHRWFCRHIESPMPTLFYLTALGMLPQWYRDGSISVAKFLLWTWLPLGLWALANWLLGRSRIPAYSVHLTEGARVQFAGPH
jgi:hypothetical protein